MPERRRDLYGARSTRRSREERQYINPAPFYDRLRELKRNVGWLADEIGVNPATIYTWLANRRTLPQTRADQIQKALGIPASKLLVSKRPTREATIDARRGGGELQYINPAAVWNRLQEMGRTVPWLAQQAEVASSTVHNWLTGRTRVPHVTAKRLAETLRLDKSKLLSPQQPRQIPDASWGESRALPYANSERIRAELEIRGWSMSELARQAGIGIATARHIVNEQQRVGPDIQVKLSQALDLPREDIVDLEPVDPVFEPKQLMEQPAPYEIRRAIEGRAGTIIRPRTTPLLDRAYEFENQASLPCGCAMYWRGGLAPEVVDVAREHYREHLASIMQEPGRAAETPGVGDPTHMPSPYGRRGGMVWPRLATGEEPPALPKKILPRRRP